MLRLLAWRLIDGTCELVVMVSQCAGAASVCQGYAQVIWIVSGGDGLWSGICGDDWIVRMGCCARSDMCLHRHCRMCGDGDRVSDVAGSDDDDLVM